MKKLLHLCVFGCFALTSFQAMGGTIGTPQRIQCKKINHKQAHRKCADQFYFKSSNIVNHSLYPFYFIKDIDTSNKILTTYDGTIWDIADEGISIASTWKLTTPLVITVNTDWFTSYIYRLRNAATGETIPANISQGPFVENSILITSIENGVVTLSNETNWTVGYWQQTSAFNKWTAGQAVLIGETASGSSPYYILINLNENNYVSVDYQP
jgi:hypothetical protein